MKETQGDGRLRVLVITSRPLAQVVPVEHGGERFEAVSPVPLESVEAVRNGLHQVFLDDETPALVRYLPWARLGDLQASLAEPYDVVHFVGHGAEDGRLFLEGNDGTADLVSPQRLAEAMREAGVRLALLSACHSGAVGRALHEAGIPSVVMVDERYPMAAEAAALFNRQFYARLARGKRPLEAFEASVRAVRTDQDFGDEKPPPRNECGEVEPRYGERFDKIVADDRPLVEGIPTAGYEELRPSKAICDVTRDEVFVGREAEMVAVIRQMRTARLVTLTAPGRHRQDGPSAPGGPLGRPTPSVPRWGDRGQVGERPRRGRTGLPVGLCAGCGAGPQASLGHHPRCAIRPLAGAVR